MSSTTANRIQRPGRGSRYDDLRLHGSCDHPNNALATVERTFDSDTSTPRLESDTSTPRVESDTSTPRVELDTSTPRVESDTSTPRVEPETTPRVHTGNVTSIANQVTPLIPHDCKRAPPSPQSSLLSFLLSPSSRPTLKDENQTPKPTGETCAVGIANTPGWPISAEFASLPIMPTSGAWPDTMPAFLHLQVTD